MGPGESGHQVQAGSPDLTPLELEDGEARLVAGRCRECDAITFPPRERCSACGGELERTPLPEQGTLWTWTTQGFEPKSPPFLPDEGEFEPFAVGYVEFPGLLRVEGRLTKADPEHLRIGMPMRVVALERAGRVTYAFAPVES